MCMYSYITINIIYSIVCILYRVYIIYVAFVTLGFCVRYKEKVFIQFPKDFFPYFF